ncbi:glucose 1-dehydrogenase [soil metagenome]
MMFKNKTVVITGAAKGIGASCARLFHRASANVAILDVDEAPSEFSDEQYFYLKCDVSRDNKVKEAFKEINNRYGNIDFLVNNAGIQRYGTVTETSIEEWDLIFNVNLKSQFLCAKYAIPYMLEQKRGVIINISSVQAFLSQEKVAAYTTAKTATLGLTRSIAIDYAPHIRCVAVCPGTIDTPMLREAINLSPNPEGVLQECVNMHLLERIGKPDEVAELVFFLCDDKASFITGQAIRIDGGIGIAIGGSKRD